MTHSIQAFLLSLVSLILFSGVSVAKEIHVAKSGKDSNAGTSTSPYVTIQKAANVAKAGDVVIIHEGTYEEKVTPANSGTAGNPIIFKSADGDKVIVTAMQALSGWTLDKDNVYKTTVNWSLGQENFIMHKSKALDLARWPNNTDGDAYTLNSLRNTGGSGKDVEFDAYLDYSKGIPKADWANGGTVFFYGDQPGKGWTTWRAFIKSSIGTRVTFDLDTDPEWVRTAHSPEGKGEFFLQGAREVLDYQNEWYFNEKTKTLYVQLPNGTKPENGAIKMRRRTQVFNLTNKNYIHIQDLAVFGGSIDIAGTGNKLYQVSSFYGNYTLGVVKGAFTWKQSVKVSGKNNIIEKCEIAYGAASGIHDAGDGTKVLNCYIHHFNTLGSYDAVLNARDGKNSLYKNNVMTVAGRDIIQAFNLNAEYCYNDVSFSNLIADDCALIYTVGGPRNSTIHHNWFHDAYSHGDKYKGAGIYLDNNASGWDVHHNVVWNTEWTSVQINWNGANINIYNNTLVKNKATMGAWHKKGTKFTNVKVWNNITDIAGTSAGGQEDEATWEPQSDKQNNLIDKASFVNHADNNFKLKADAKAIDYGRVIDGVTNGYKGAKPDVGAYEYGDQDWKPGVDWDLANGPTGSGAYGLPGEGYVPDGVEPVEENKVAFSALPDQILQSKSIPVTVEYTALKELEVVVVLYASDGTWLGNGKQTVQKGTGKVDIIVTLEALPAIGEAYKIVSDIRPVNGAWDSWLKKEEKTIDVVSKSFKETAIAIPGTIEAEEYDNGGEGIAYHDTDIENKLGEYRKDGVDIEVCGEGAFNVGQINENEWLAYTVNVIGTGSYTFTVRTASAGTGGTFHIEVDGEKIGKSLIAPVTDGWQIYTDVVITDISLDKGEHTVKFVSESKGYNLDKIIVSKTTVPVQGIQMKKGWNLVGCPLEGETDVKSALGSIWDKVEVVKDMDSFYSADQEPFLNSLTKIEYGKGYFVKVSEDCELVWK